MPNTLFKTPQKTGTALQLSTFNIRMAYSCTSFLVLSLIGCYLTRTPIRDVGESAIVLCFGCIMFCPLPIYWHGKGRKDMRDAAMTIPWCLVLLVILPIPVEVFARLGLPLQDFRLAQTDNIFGVHIPTITAWASHSLLGNLVNRCYHILTPLMPVSFLLPALTGRVKYAQRFLLSNLIAFAIGLPLFYLVPAIGPWHAYGTTPSPEQVLCQESLLHLRSHASMASINTVICFPSFHVIWAILCAAALWAYKPLRVPIILLCGLIIISTMTTGWHYFSDVLAGVVVAIISIKVSFLLTQDCRLIGDLDSELGSVDSR